MHVKRTNVKKIKVVDMYQRRLWFPIQDISLLNFIVEDFLANEYVFNLESLESHLSYEPSYTI